MRLFIAIELDDGIRNRIAQFIENTRGLAPSARWVRPESLHVTLKFIGEQPEESIENIKRKLEIIESPAFELALNRSGFFPDSRSPRVFWIGVEAGPSLAALADLIDTNLAALGIAKEERAFNPHLTLARGDATTRRTGGSKTKPAPKFERLQARMADCSLPDFGVMVAAEFFLYRSQLSSQGSKYSKLARFPLRQS